MARQGVFETGEPYPNKNGKVQNMNHEDFVILDRLTNAALRKHLGRAKLGAYPVEPGERELALCGQFGIYNPKEQRFNDLCLACQKAAGLMWAKEYWTEERWSSDYWDRVHKG